LAEARLFAHHTVFDLDAWKKGYDASAPEQKKAGVLRKSVYRSVDSPNEVTVIHNFELRQKAKAFVATPGLTGLIARIGVQGKVQVWITTTAEKIDAFSMSIYFFDDL